MLKVAFFGAKPYVKDIFREHNAGFNYQLEFIKSNLGEENAQKAQGFNVVCVFVNDCVTDKVLKTLKECGVQLLALRCAGFNNVDLKVAQDLSIPVVRVPEYSPYAVAEYAFSVLSTLNRKIHRAYEHVREYDFRVDHLMGMDLNGKTVGVIGTGKIGQIFIKIAKGYGMNVIAYDLYPNQEAAKSLGFTYTSLEEIYKTSDVISLHCPLSPETKYLINKESLNQMKKGVIIINSSRGGLVNTKDLIEALKEKKIGALGMDVYENEHLYFFEDFSGESGIEDDNLARLLSFNNVIITPHQAFFTKEALDNIASVTLNNIRSYFEKKELPNQVKA